MSLLLRSLSKSNPRDPTQKLHPPPKTHVPRTEDDINVQPPSVQDDQSIITHASPTKPQPKPKSHLHLHDLPIEVLDQVLGYLVGSLGAVSSANVVRNWNEHMRHPRRKDAGDLAFVSRVWRELIQKRLYRHIKIQGTTVALEECSDHFLSSPHLQRHVKHLQVICPIWEMKPGSKGGRNTTNIPPIPTQRRDYSGRIPQTIIIPVPEEPVTPSEREQNQFFQPASDNATLEETFSTAKVLFPQLSALTIEAGHCKKPPQIQYFRPRSTIQPWNIISMRNYRAAPKASFMPENLPHLPQVTALMIKGAWNVIRTPSDFEKLSKALPSLMEFTCNFHALKSQAYGLMNMVIKRHWPINVTHLSITLDGLYSKANSGPEKWRKIYPTYHICLELATRLPLLTSLTYTGRVCHQIFHNSRRGLEAQEWPSSNKNRNLKSVDLIVHALCCDPRSQPDVTGIDHLPFILGFEDLIFEAVASLTVFSNLDRLRIRYIDLDSPRPLLNPTFHLEKGSMWGMWSDRIVAAVQGSRPDVEFLGERDMYEELLADESGDVDTLLSKSIDYYRWRVKKGVLIH